MTTAKAKTLIRKKIDICDLLIQNAVLGSALDECIIAKALMEDRGRVMVSHRLLFQNDHLLNIYLSFPDNLLGVFVIAKLNEFVMKSVRSNRFGQSAPP